MRAAGPDTACARHCRRLRFESGADSFDLSASAYDSEDDEKKITKIAHEFCKNHDTCQDVAERGGGCYFCREIKNAPGPKAS
jgi:hypothetical protein